jgi:arylsulfatase A-like enzyme
MFERGFAGHGFEFMYEPVLHVPLLIHAPGQANRNDVLSTTSNADILPTLLHINGKEIPSDIDGKVLPQLGGMEDSERPIFSIYAVDNSAFGPMKKAVIAMHKGKYKLIAYLGYKNIEAFELYNLAADPEELSNLASKELKILSQLTQEFQSHLNDANRPFIK